MLIYKKILIVSFSLLVTTSAACRKITTIDIRLDQGGGISKIVLTEYVNSVAKAKKREVFPGENVSHVQIGYEGPYSETGKYYIGADAFDQTQCLVATGRTEEMEIAAISAPGPTLSLAITSVVAPQATRTDAWCSTQGASIGRLTGENTANMGRTGSLLQPSDVCWDPQCGTLYVSDTGHHRILGYKNLRFDNLRDWENASPDFVLGAKDKNSPEVNPAPVSPYSLNRPTGLWCGESGVLIVADTGNNRVLFYNPPESNPCTYQDQASPAGVLGQNDFVSGDMNRDGGSIPSAASLKSPTAVYWDVSHRPYRLWVADSGNNRVLSYSLLGTSEFNRLGGRPATVVWGQRSLTQAVAGSGNIGLSQPYGVSLAAGGERRLIVTDTGNARVVVYPADAPFVEGTALSADAVLGQVSFTATQPGSQAGQLYGPLATHTTLQQAFVADALNRRIQIFSATALDAGSLGYFAETLPLSTELPGLNPQEFEPSAVRPAEQAGRQILLVVGLTHPYVLSIPRTLP